MKSVIFRALSFVLICLIYVHAVFSCTTFCMKGKGEMLFGKNYDFPIGDGLVLVNKRGVQKVSITEDDGNPVKWTSKYGSITFNQFGRENPNGGMNERGLVIELMWLDETIYPAVDKRPTIEVPEWIQYQLDTAATVDEVIKNTEALRMTSDVKIHYLVNDSQGNSATIECIGGKLVVHSGKDIETPALTNDTYENSVKYAETTLLEKAKTDGSLDRFTRVTQKTKEFEKWPKTGQEAVDYAFATLKDAEQKGFSSDISNTVWSIVYDQKRGRVYFRTLTSPSIKSVDTRSFDYSCGTPVKMFDMNAKEAGDVTAKFTDYSRKANRDLIESTFTQTPWLKFIPKTYRDLAASYPEEFVCTEKTSKP